MASTFESVARWRVTPENPSQGFDGLDFERCAALHNFIVSHAWTSFYGRSPEQLDFPTWWAVHANESEALRPRLHPYIVEFLKRAHVLPNEAEISFFKYLYGLHVPSMLWLTGHFGEEDCGDRFLTLYATHAELGSNPDGLVYDQADDTVHMNFSIEDLDAYPMDVLETEWLKLETVLSIYIDMIERGKAVALPQDFFHDSAPDVDPAAGALKPCVDFARPWVVVPYAKSDLADTLAIWDELVAEIERRMPANAAPNAAPEYGLVDAEQLDAIAITPRGSFAYELLSRARRPRFAFIAPGMRLLTLEEFTGQPYREIDFGEGPNFRKPVRLFVVEHDSQCAADSMPSGFYLDECQIRDSAPFEDAVLVRWLFQLPHPGVWEIKGVEKFGLRHGSQMLAVLENMYVNVTQGHWQVDENGVAGGISVFQDADAAELEQWYHIPVGPGRFW